VEWVTCHPLRYDPKQSGSARQNPASTALRQRPWRHDPLQAEARARDHGQAALGLSAKPRPRSADQRLTACDQGSRKSSAREP